MARERKNGESGLFFMATLVLWGVSVLFETVFNGRRELAAVAAGFVFYQLANAVVRRSLAAGKDPLFVNTAVSLLHSFLTSASVILILLNQCVVRGPIKMFEYDELFDGVWFGAYSALCFSCGYFAYDQLDMLRRRLYSGWIPGILLHHLILLICFTLALFRNVTINYLILTLVCELHSIFLHVRKVRRMAGPRDGNSRIVRIEWILNWFTFFTARVGCHVFITYKLIVDAPKFSKGIELPLALSGMAGMNLLNLFLGRDLYNAYTREMRQHRSKD